MSTIYKKYIEFVIAICKDKLYEETRLDYVDICQALRISPIELSEILFRELGLSGEDYLNCLRKGQRWSCKNISFL